MDYKIALGLLATIIGFAGYIPYFMDIFRGKTKPHVFTWLGFAILTGVAFAAQLTKGAGPGAWVTACTAAVCLLIAVLALNRGEKNITKSDWFCIVASLVGIGLWFFLKDPLWAVIVITVADFLSFLPTIRKSYLKPHEETVSTYMLSSLKFVFAVVALESFDVTNWLYPASLVLANGGFAIMLLVRRWQQIKKV